MKDIHEDLAWKALQNELLPAWRLYGVTDIEVVAVSRLGDGQGIVLQLRDSRGMRVSRQTIPVTLLERTEKILSLLMAGREEKKLVVSVVQDQQTSDDPGRPLS